MSWDRCPGCCSPRRTCPWSRGTPASDAASSTSCSSASHRGSTAVLGDLDRVLRQRNSLLRSASALRGGGARSRSAAEGTLSVWDDQLAAAGGGGDRGACTRSCSRLADPVAAAYRAVAPSDADPAVLIAYVSGVPGRGRPGQAGVAGQVRLALAAARRDEEFARGMTLVGPHRDELVPDPARQAVAWLRVPRGVLVHGPGPAAGVLRHCPCRGRGAEASPVLILDDVFAELDPDRRERLAVAVAGVEQVLVTAASPRTSPRPVVAGAGGVRPDARRARRDRGRPLPAPAIPGRPGEPWAGRDRVGSAFGCGPGAGPGRCQGGPLQGAVGRPIRCPTG